MKREVCKFFSGSFAALAYVHAAYAVATSRGIINEPVFLGRRWGVGYMWTEAAVYSAVSVWYLATSAGAPKRERGCRNRQRLRPRGRASHLWAQVTSLSS